MQHLRLPPQGVVIWDWQWVENNAESSITHVSDTSINHISETSFGDLDSDEIYCSNAEESAIFSTVTFKCIGTQHDSHA